MKKSFVFLANGFEEIEALATVDVLRRAGIETKTVTISSSLQVTGAHGIEVKADISLTEIECNEKDFDPNKYFRYSGHVLKKCSRKWRFKKYDL